MVVAITRKTLSDLERSGYHVDFDKCYQDYYRKLKKRYGRKKLWELVAFGKVIREKTMYGCVHFFRKNYESLTKNKFLCMCKESEGIRELLWQYGCMLCGEYDKDEFESVCSRMKEFIDAYVEQNPILLMMNGLGYSSDDTSNGIKCLNKYLTNGDK